MSTPAAKLAQFAIGPALAGGTVAFALYGISVCQMVLWFTKASRSNAPCWMKIFVGYLFFADSLHTILVAIFLYQSLIVHYNDAPHLNRMTSVFATEPALTGIIGGSVQLFYAYRITTINKQIRTAIVVAVLAIISILTAIGTAIACGIIGQFSNFYKMKVPAMVWLLSGIMADVIITVTMVRHINTLRNGIVTTDAFINKFIMRLLLQTGMLTALFAISDLLLYLTVTSALHLIFNFPLSKLYTNSLMSVLNSCYSEPGRKRANLQTGTNVVPVFTTGQDLYVDDMSLDTLGVTVASSISSSH